VVKGGRGFIILSAQKGRLLKGGGGGGGLFCRVKEFLVLLTCSILATEGKERKKRLSFCARTGKIVYTIKEDPGKERGGGGDILLLSYDHVGCHSSIYTCRLRKGEGGKKKGEGGKELPVFSLRGQ